MANEALLQYLVIFLGVILVIAPLLLCAVLWIASKLGWETMARQCRSGSRPAGRMVHWVNGWFAWYSAYNNCLNAVVTDEGVWLRPIWPFHFRHPAVLLPWKLCRETREGKLLGWKHHRHAFAGEGWKFSVLLPKQ